MIWGSPESHAIEEFCKPAIEKTGGWLKKSLSGSNVLYQVEICIHAQTAEKEWEGGGKEGERESVTKSLVRNHVW